MNFLEKHFHPGGVHQLRTKCLTLPRHDKVRLQCTVYQRHSTDALRMCGKRPNYEVKKTSDILLEPSSLK